MMQVQETCGKPLQTQDYPTFYHEERIGGTLYRVTSVFKGEFQLKDALEDLAVRRALQAASSNTEI